MTECKQGKFEFQGIFGRRVEGRFDGGMSSDGRLVLIRELMEGQRFFSRLAGCFTDHLIAEVVTHSVESLLKQMVCRLLVAGYEDLNDHDALRSDPTMQLVREQVSDDEAKLASHSTLSRIELVNPKNLNPYLSNGTRISKICFLLLHSPLCSIFGRSTL